MTRASRYVISLTAVALPALMIGSSSHSSGYFEPPATKHDPQIGRSFKVPYRLTDTNHFLVRVRLNGKGPFNFLVDSGAPALYVATETAKKIGLEPPPGKFWTPVESLELEGGSRLTDLKARVEDPFQLVGMNALGLPGASIDGILGFTILARYRLEIDPTKDRMIWTRLDYEPRDPPMPDHKPGDDHRGPAGVQAMGALGPLAKGLALLIGKQPEEERQPQGFLGLEWAEDVRAGRKQVVVLKVLADLPAARGGLQAGDRIIRINDHEVLSLQAARAELANVHPGRRVFLDVNRRTGNSERELRLTLTAGEGL